MFNFPGQQFSKDFSHGIPNIFNGNPHFPLYPPPNPIISQKIPQMMPPVLNQMNNNGNNNINNNVQNDNINTTKNNEKNIPISK